ncbi:MAG: hypothetical protein QW067_12765 [Thermofilaceae archaeon]
MPKLPQDLTSTQNIPDKTSQHQNSEIQETITDININPHPSTPIPFTLSPKEIIELVHSTTPQMMPVKAIGKLYLKNGYFRLVGPDNYEITLENVKDYSLIDSIVEMPVCLPPSTNQNVNLILPHFYYLPLSKIHT